MGIFKDEEKTGPVRSASAPVASGTPAAQNSPVATPVPAKVTVAKHGGLRGGKPREDDLVPGSPEAAKADREKDAERKRIERAERAAALAPKPLPGAQGYSVQESSSAGAGAGVVDRPRVPWTEGILRPLSNQGIKVGELVYVGKMSKRATEAQLPGQLVKEARTDAEELCKQVHDLFAVALPQVAAKWLNKSGVSPENAPEVALLTAVGTLCYLHFQNAKKMDDVAEKIKEIKKAEAAKANPNVPAFSVNPGAASGNPS